MRPVKVTLRTGPFQGVGGLCSKRERTDRPVINRRYIKLCMPDMGTRARFLFFLSFFFLFGGNGYEVTSREEGMTSGSGHGNRDSKQSRNRANRVEWRIEDFNKRQAGQSSLFQ